MRELCFINVHKPGQEGTQHNKKAAQIHIRRAVLKNRGCRDIGERIKLFNVEHHSLCSVSSGKILGEESNKSANPAEVEQAHSYDHNLNFGRPSENNVSCITTSHIYARHPYTTYAASAVRLPVERIDFLFKSSFFRNAAEPLFDTSHVDSNFSMNAVFPECLTAPTFLKALLYSIVQTTNKGKPNVEGLQLMGTCLQGLSETLSNTKKRIDHADIGAILILQGVSYRWNDPKTYETHTKGLIDVINCVKGEGSFLTAWEKRAMFWQDLFASLLINSKRRHTHVIFPQIMWRRETRPNPLSSLPKGFLEHHDALSEEILYCIEDIVELQATIQNMTKSSVDRLQLSNMQASIESRLAFEAQACSDFNPIAGCCCIAALITCFLSFTQTWANPLIPCRLSKLLRERLKQSLHSLIWSKRRNLQIWLALVGSYASLLDNGQVDRLQESWNKLVIQVLGLRSERSVEQWLCESDMKSAQEDFIYCNESMQSSWQNIT